MNPSMKMNNIKPFEEERVAPGLDKGYNTTSTSIGFNSGMEARDLWKPKTVGQPQESAYIGPKVMAKTTVQSERTEWAQHRSSAAAAARNHTGLAGCRVPPVRKQMMLLVISLPSPRSAAVTMRGRR